MVTCTRLAVGLMGVVWESPTDVPQASAQGNLARAQARG